MYYYDSRAPKFAKELKPSARSELEITDLNKKYLERGELEVKIMGRGFAWLDTGTYDSLLEASNFVKIIEERQNQMIGCIEEIAYRKGYITKEQLLKIAEKLKKTSYGKYLYRIAEED